ncbi:MAG: glycosyltransferase family 4 protein [Candidatus Schekmanbacteria bacterium]|nr:glycosyltransferase family 4 protein [Candidatus Schekmanbacteria bacterium]
MKILLCHKYFYERGGAERFLFELIDILKRKKHETIIFSMEDVKNRETQYAKYFVSNLDYQNNSTTYKLKNIFKIVGRIIYSKNARNKIESLINDTEPDIAHLNLIYHHISPSILYSLKKHNIPIIINANDCKLVCPNYYLYNPVKGETCEKCVGGHFYHCLMEKCFKDSRSSSLLATAEMYIHNLLKIYKDNIDVFITPSRFMEEMLIKGGFPEEKIITVNHPFDVKGHKPCFDPGEYYIYAGRLIKEKGIMTLLEASNRVRNKKLIIAGFESDAAIAAEVKDRRKYPNVEYVGLKFGDELFQLFRNASFSVVPSECYDVFPFAVIESFATGKPVVGARIGGIPELIDDGKNGFLFEAGNADDLADKINILAQNPGMAAEFGRQAREKAETHYSHESYYNKLSLIYDNAISSKKTKLQ